MGGSQSKCHQKGNYSINAPKRAITKPNSSTKTSEWTAKVTPTAGRCLKNKKMCPPTFASSSCRAFCTIPHFRRLHVMSFLNLYASAFIITYLFGCRYTSGVYSAHVQKSSSMYPIPALQPCSLSCLFSWHKLGCWLTFDTYWPVHAVLHLFKLRCLVATFK